MTKSNIPFRPRPLSYAVASVLAVGTAAAAFGIPFQAQAKGEAADDGLTPVCEPGLEKAANSDDILALYEIGDGTMISAPAMPDAASKCMKLTSAGYSLSLDGLGLTVVSGGGNPVSYLGSDRSLTLDTASPVLCESYFTGSSGYKVSATNSNDELLGGATGLKGVSSLAYNPGNGVITPNLMAANFGPWINCVSKNTANTRGDATTFSGSFESGPDIHVAYLDEAGNPLAGNEVFATIDGASATVSYKVRITNRGDSAVTGIRLREYLPKTGGAIVPTVTASGCLNDAGSPNCAADAYGALSLNFSSLPAPGAGPAGEDNSLAPGESVTYRLTRTVNSSSAGAVAETFVAAFVNPDTTNDFRPSNNARQLRIVLQDNALPVADVKSVLTDEDTSVGVTFTGSDSDGSVVSWNIASQPANGTLSGSGNSRTYTPAADFNGTDSFTYRAVDDDGGQSAPATVTITVTPVNDAPRYIASSIESQGITYAEEQEVGILIGSSFTDPEGDTISYNLSGGLPDGLSYNGTLRAIVGTVDQSACGAASCAFPLVLTASDGQASTAHNFSLTINNVNQDPQASAILDPSPADEGSSPIYDVHSYFTDPDGDSLTYSAMGLPDGLVINQNTGVIDGVVSQTATGSNQSKIFAVTVTANDGQGGSVDGAFSWTVNRDNVAPTVSSQVIIDGLGLDLCKDNLDSGQKFFAVTHANQVLAFEDEDGDPLTVSDIVISSAQDANGQPISLPSPSDVGFSFDGGSPSSGGVVVTAGEYHFDVTVYDGEDSTTAADLFTLFAYSGAGECN